MVLGQCQGQVVRSLADDGRADFVTLQVVFDHYNIACVTKDTLDHYLVNGITSRCHF